jgi:hypothetical protein
MRTRAAIGIAGAVVSLSAAVGCAGNSGSAASSSLGGGEGVAGSTAANLPYKSAGPVGASRNSAVGGTVQAESRTPPLPSTVIKTAQLSLRVKSDRFGDAIQQAQQISSSLGGLVLSTTVVKHAPGMADVVVRVPASEFDRALQQLRKVGGGTVLSEEISGQDVSQEFVDLGARERNLQAQERVLLRLMNRAVTITDTIRVENELAQVQGQIEQIHGRLLYLHDQADLSTITVSMRETVAATTAGKPGELHRAFTRAWDGTVAVITGVIVGAGIVLPVALLLAIAAFVGLRVWRPIRRRLEGAVSPPAG